MSEKENKEITVNDRLIALYKLQVIDSKIDELRRLRGDTPLKVKDLEDEVVGLKTRQEKLESEIESFNEQISDKKNIIKSAKEKLKKYSEQQDKVRNNREYEALSKQIEFEELEIQLSEKRIKEYTEEIEKKEETLKDSNSQIEERHGDLEQAKKELESVVVETEKDENELKEFRTKIEETIEKRLLNAYIRIRKGVRNGLAVVAIERESCGGCFNRIPPQRQIDVESHKKIIVCEFCGRILIDDEVVVQVEDEMKNFKINLWE